jgi:site-specific recombinase XerD
LECYGRNLVRFGAYVEQQGGAAVATLPEWIAPFLAQLKLGQHWIGQWGSLLNGFVRDLRERGLVPMPTPSDKHEPFAELVAEYATFLAEQRGVSDDGVAGIRSCCRAFLAHVQDAGIADLRTLSSVTIHRFIASEGKHFARHTLSGRCSALRRFLSFLHMRGCTSTDLSVFVVAPRLYAHERCPRFVTRPEIRAVLSSVDRRSTLGLRDYSMLLLLATYGLRGIEVIRLRLDDIDWRNEKLYIRRRKAGNETVYPLAPSVARALLAYFKRGRPKTANREVFITLSAPFRALRRTSALGHVARRQFAKVGVRVERPGTHTFRYSCAQALLEDNTPLKTIGDYLGHRSPASTQRYTMIALSELRDVAMSDGEDLL